MKVVDSHVHVWDPSRFHYGWLANEPVLDRTFLPESLPHTLADTSAAVFVQADCQPEQALDEVDWVAGLAAGWPQLSAIVAFAPLSRGNDVAADLELLLQRPLVRGIRQLFQDQDDSFLLAPDTLAGARQVARAGLSFDACIRSRQLPALAEFADRVPGLQIVLDHMGKPPIASGDSKAWSTGMRELARRPNVVVKLSGAGAEAHRASPVDSQARPYIIETLEHFGADRCMFGSDFPVSLGNAAGYREWLNTVNDAIRNSSAGERESVSSATASRVYRLEL